MATTRADRALPAILRRRANTPAEKAAAFDALLKLLKLSHPTEEDDHEFWRALAEALVRRFPAFKPARGSKKQLFSDSFMRDWVAAAGSLPGLLVNETAFEAEARGATSASPDQPHSSLKELSQKVAYCLIYYMRSARACPVRHTFRTATRCCQ